MKQNSSGTKTDDETSFDHLHSWRNLEAISDAPCQRSDSRSLVRLNHEKPWWIDFSGATKSISNLTSWHLFKMVAFSMLNNRSFQYFIRSTILWASLKVVESGNGRKRKGVCALEMHLLSWTLPFKQTNSEELDMKTEKGGGFHLWKEASFLLCHSFPPYVMTAPFNYTFQEHENI